MVCSALGLYVIHNGKLFQECKEFPGKIVSLKDFLLKHFLKIKSQSMKNNADENKNTEWPPKNMYLIHNLCRFKSDWYVTRKIDICDLFFTNEIHKKNHKSRMDFFVTLSFRKKKLKI